MYQERVCTPVMSSQHRWGRGDPGNGGFVSGGAEFRVWRDASTSGRGVDDEEMNAPLVNLNMESVNGICGVGVHCCVTDCLRWHRCGHASVWMIRKSWRGGGEDWRGDSVDDWRPRALGKKQCVGERQEFCGSRKVNLTLDFWGIFQGG